MHLPRNRGGRAVVAGKFRLVRVHYEVGINLAAIFRINKPRQKYRHEFRFAGFAEELIFDRIDLGYIVAVASGEGTGRSATAQLLHASEVAFWDDLPIQMAALMQTVPDLPGTEIILETTANGHNASALRHKLCRSRSMFRPMAGRTPTGLS